MRHLIVTFFTKAFQKSYNINEMNEYKLPSLKGVLIMLKTKVQKILLSSTVVLLLLSLGGCANTTNTKSASAHPSTTDALTSKKIVSPTMMTTAGSVNTLLYQNQSVYATAPINKSNNLQVGLNDIATWTDEQGIHHHVDSDGIDRQTTSGSQQVNYQNWSGALPQSATIMHNQSTNQQQGQEFQLGLGDVAMWTDGHGINHHVDSDGMDRQTTNGSQQIHYQNWSGSLPQNATVLHNQGATPQHGQEIQLGSGDIATWTDEHGINHHVDSDGMDRQTTDGSQQVNYQDWSGSLPADATVIHQ